MGTGKDIAQTVKERLQTLTEDERSHRAVSADISFDLRRCLPVPFMEAVKSLSEANGLHDEAVAWCFYSNIAFLEHHGRRVGHVATCVISSLAFESNEAGRAAVSCVYLFGCESFT